MRGLRRAIEFEARFHKHAATGWFCPLRALRQARQWVGCARPPHDAASRKELRLVGGVRASRLERSPGRCPVPHAVPAILFGLTNADARRDRAEQRKSREAIKNAGCQRTETAIAATALRLTGRARQGPRMHSRIRIHKRAGAAQFQP